MDGNELILQQLPSGVVNPNAMLLLAAGCAIDQAVLFNEVKRLDLPRDRLVVDPRAVLINDGHREQEMDGTGRIGSTGSGTGAALIDRMWRKPHVKLSAYSPSLSKFARVEPVAPLLHDQLNQGTEIIIEGTQGFGLSLFHGFSYPFVTARDTSAAAFASEVGISPRVVDRIIMVVRTFPIRVGGPSGPLKDEITWQDVRDLSGAPEVVPEFTSVTHRMRRVGRFDADAVKIACSYNHPSELAVMGLDRLDHGNHLLRRARDLTQKANAFLEMVESCTGVRVNWVGTGFRTEDACERQPAE
jgi:adenylosuccinate synthase